MAIQTADNFSYRGKKPNFERDSFATLAAMRAFDVSGLDEGHVSFCQETKRRYEYHSSNEVSPITGKWKLLGDATLVQLTGDDSTVAMSQAAVTQELDKRPIASPVAQFSPTETGNIVNVPGDSEVDAASQKLVTDLAAEANVHAEPSGQSIEDVDDTLANTALRKTPQTLTAAEKAQVQQNLNVPDKTVVNNAITAIETVNGVQTDLLVELDKTVRPVIIYLNGQSTVNADGTSKRISLGLHELGTTAQLSLMIGARKGGVALDITRMPVEVNGQAAPNGSYAITATESTEYIVATEYAYDIAGKEVREYAEAEAYVTFVNAMYFGFAQYDSMLDVHITSLDKQPLKTSPNGTYTLVSPSNGYMWLCVPNTMTINKVTMSGFEVPIEQKTTGAPAGYKCYRSSNELVAGTYTIVIS